MEGDGYVDREYADGRGRYLSESERIALKETVRRLSPLRELRALSHGSDAAELDRKIAAVNQRCEDIIHHRAGL